ncbi:MAG: Ldh family oxidoreductase [Gemmataceae bacterium]
MPTVSTSELTAFSEALFAAHGVPTDEAAVVAQSLVGANLRGHDSHGVLRIPQYLDAIREGRSRPSARLEILDESPVLLAADAGWGLGQVQAHRLLDRLMPKAKSMGVAAGTLRRCGHTGRLGEYAERVAAGGLALIGMVNSHGSGNRVAPPGGTEGRLSTNPLCIGVPTAGEPLVLDIGTSVCAEGKVRVAFQKGVPVPEGWLLDAAGRPTTDPGVLYREPRGTILPLGGAQAYKGFGLSLLLDALCGGLSGGACSRGDPPPVNGNTVLFVLLDTARFGGSDHFLKEVGGMAAYVRGCPPAAGVEQILLPGDPERLTLEKRRASGITILDGLWGVLTGLASAKNVVMPTVTTEQAKA